MWIVNPLDEDGERITTDQIHLYDLIDPERRVENLGEKIASCLVQTLPIFMMENIMEETNNERTLTRLEDYIGFSTQGNQLFLDRTTTWNESESFDPENTEKKVFYATNLEINLSQEYSIVQERKLDLPTEIIDFRSIVG